MATQTSSSRPNGLQPHLLQPGDLAPDLLQPNLLQPDLTRTSWTGLSGTILSGGFELQEVLQADGPDAQFKVRVLGDRDLDCVARFSQAASARAEEQVELWALTRQLRHPNVSAPLGMGQQVVNGHSAVYVVVRRADESLDTVLKERALTVDEVGEVLTSVVRALEVLHLNGLCYGCLAPSRVLAVGDSIKLPVECVRASGVAPLVRVFNPAYLAPESAGENLTAEADIWCLGATLFEALTQQALTEESQATVAALPEPFASIAQRCLHPVPEGRARLTEVIALFRGELKPTPRVRAAAAGSFSSLEAQDTGVAEWQQAGFDEAPHIVSESRQSFEPESVSHTYRMAPDLREEEEPASFGQGADVRQVPPYTPESDTTVSNPATTLTPRGPTLSRPRAGRPTFDEAIQNEAVIRRRAPADEPDEPAISLWVWAGLALLVVLGFVWALRPKTISKKPVVASVASVTPSSGAAAVPNAKSIPEKKAVEKGAIGANAWETRTLQPDGTAVRATSAKDAGNTAGAASNGEIWRVVAFTYSHRQDAEKKVHSINAKHSSLHAELFSPSGSGAPYLVAVGGRMSREQAAQAKRRAISAGLPRDSYIQNYAR